MTENKEIYLEVVPKIVHQLQTIGARVTTRLAELNIDKLVATEETVKTLKTLRAELNKELENFEGQRKLIKTGVLNPYEQFEALYKVEISTKYGDAITSLKDKIAIVETKVKDEKKAKVEAYFRELCIAEKLDFLKFENVGLEINLSTTEKSYKEQCNKFVEQVAGDLALIGTQEHKAEILVEYKIDLNISRAITFVSNRKEAEKIETERLKQAETNRRVVAIKGLGFNLDEFSNSYIYDNEIYLSRPVLEGLDKEEFNAQIIAFETEINAKQQPSEQTAAPTLFDAPKEQVMQPPVEVKKADQVRAAFEVVGTMEQLKSLGNFLKTNKITYKNL